MKYILLCGIMMLMAACSTPPKKEKAQEEHAMDVQECIAYGYDEGTAQFEQCITLLEEARAEKEVQRIHHEIENMQYMRQRSQDRNF